MTFIVGDNCIKCKHTDCVEVCPVENCITMVEQPAGTVDPRTGETVVDDYANWTTHPNNPGAVAAE